MKNTKKEKVSGNHRPIACLPLMLKLLTQSFMLRRYTIIFSKTCFQVMNRKAAEKSQVTQKTNY